MVQDFIICMCVLVYTANVLGRRMSRWQTALQVWAQAQGDCFAEPAKKKAFLELLPAECEAELRDWVELTLNNADIDVPSDAEKRHDFMLITDASVHTWCGIILSLKTGQSTVVHWWRLAPGVLRPSETLDDSGTHGGGGLREYLLRAICRGACAAHW